MAKWDWTPDLAEHGHDGLVKARNCYASILGYEPMKQPSAVTAAVDAEWKGGGAFQGSDGTTVLLAATPADLFTLTASVATSVYTVATTGNWHFAQFGDIVIGVHGGAPVKYTITSGVGDVLGGTPPNAAYVAIVKDFVFLAGDSSDVATVTWSAINDAEGWTVGTDQCDEQLIPDGGAITGLAGGEYGLVFQDTAIHVFEYQGSGIIFARRKVSSSIGAMCHGSIAQHGRQTFFYSRRGFYKFIDGEVVPIGRNKIDRTFRNTYSVEEIIANMRCTVDPERSLVIWSMPDRLWIYNWDNDKWTDVSVVGLVGISSGATASVTLEEIAVLFPAIEDVTPVLDDPVWRGGEPMLLIAKTDGILYSFGSETTLEASFRLTQQEMFPGRTAHVRNCRVIGNMEAASVSMDCRARMGDSPVNVFSSDFRSNGEVPIRASGRYIQPEIIIPAGTQWSNVQGFEMEASPGGRL